MASVEHSSHRPHGIRRTHKVHSSNRQTDPEIPQVMMTHREGMMSNAIGQNHRRPPSSASRPRTSQSSNNNSTAMSGSNSSCECVKVVVRSRPLYEWERREGHGTCVRVDPKEGSLELANPKDSREPAKCFSFDAVYDQSSRQADIYDEAVRPIVDSVLRGFNGTVFAYGQTGTGKTYTMQGPSGSEKSAATDQRGVIPNAIDHIFDHIAQSPPSQQYLVRASFLEIYQEEIRDLLDVTAKRLELKERPDTGIYVNNLSSFVTQCVDEIDHVLRVGHANRSVGRTNMNEHSSRSHAILMVTVECSEPGPDGQPHIRVGRLNLVDLAGSERQSKTGSEGQRFREATKINLSLSALGNVIAALSDRQSGHIPYRDSKLTRLLQDSLGGNAKTVMIANIGPASYNYEETLSTLRYSARAKQIQNKPRINEDPKDALLREFQDEITRLKALLQQRGTKRRKSRISLLNLNNAEEEENGSAGMQAVDSSADSAEREAEENFRERQLKLDMERQRLMRNSQIIEEEKRRILAELEQREQDLERERQEQLEVAAKIRQMQNKLLSGDGNLLDRTRRQDEMLRQKRAELTDQKRREREIAQRLEVQELETAEVRHSFASLQQEVEAKRRKLHKLHAKLQQMRLELRDNEAANAVERQSLEQAVLEMNKELALKWLIVDNFVPPALVERLKERAVFDENEHRWLLLPEGRPPTHSSALERRHSVLVENSGGGFEQLNLLAPFQQQPGMADSGLGSSNGGGSQGPSDCGSQEDCPAGTAAEFEQYTQQSVSSAARMLKRPTALAGVRRPITEWELAALARLRHRLARTTSAKAGSRQSGGTQGRDQMVLDLTVHEEMLRFCCENVLTFQSLAPFPSEVRPSLEADRAFGGRATKSATGAHQPLMVPSAPSPGKVQRLVLDTSRIPVPLQRSASREGSGNPHSRPNSRPASAAGRRRPSGSGLAFQFQQSAGQQQLEASQRCLSAHLPTLILLPQQQQKGEHHWEQQPPFFPSNRSAKKLASPQRVQQQQSKQHSDHHCWQTDGRVGGANGEWRRQPPASSSVDAQWKQSIPQHFQQQPAATEEAEQSDGHWPLHWPSTSAGGTDVSEGPGTGWPLWHWESGNWRQEMSSDSKRRAELAMARASSSEEEERRRAQAQVMDNDDELNHQQSLFASWRRATPASSLSSADYCCPSPAMDSSSRPRWSAGEFTIRPVWPSPRRSRIPVLMSHSYCAPSALERRRAAIDDEENGKTPCSGGTGSGQRRRRWGQQGNPVTTTVMMVQSTAAISQELVPFLPCQQWSASTRSSREQLSSPADTEKQIISSNGQRRRSVLRLQESPCSHQRQSSNSSTEEEEANTNNNNELADHQWPVQLHSSWAAIDQAQSLIAKVRAGRKPTKFRTQPALLKPMDIPAVNQSPQQQQSSVHQQFLMAAPSQSLGSLSANECGSFVHQQNSSHETTDFVVAAAAAGKLSKTRGLPFFKKRRTRRRPFHNNPMALFTVSALQHTLRPPQNHQRKTMNANSPDEQIAQQQQLNTSTPQPAAPPQTVTNNPLLEVVAFFAGLALLFRLLAVLLNILLLLLLGQGPV